MKIARKRSHGLQLAIFKVDRIIACTLAATSARVTARKIESVRHKKILTIVKISSALIYLFFLKVAMKHGELF